MKKCDVYPSLHLQLAQEKPDEVVGVPWRSSPPQPAKAASAQSWRRLGEQNSTEELTEAPTKSTEELLEEPSEERSEGPLEERQELDQEPDEEPEGEPKEEADGREPDGSADGETDAGAEPEPDDEDKDAGQADQAETGVVAGMEGMTQPKEFAPEKASDSNSEDAGPQTNADEDEGLAEDDVGSARGDAGSGGGEDSPNGPDGPGARPQEEGEEEADEDDNVDDDDEPTHDDSEDGSALDGDAIPDEGDDASGLQPQPGGAAEYPEFGRAGAGGSSLHRLADESQALAKVLSLPMPDDPLSMCSPSKIMSLYDVAREEAPDIFNVCTNLVVVRVCCLLPTLVLFALGSVWGHELWVKLSAGHVRPAMQRYMSNVPFLPQPAESTTDAWRPVVPEGSANTRVSCSARSR